MAPPITTFVDVTVVVGGATATKFSFGSLMLVAEHNVNALRQSGPFFSVTEMNSAGFTSTATPAINAWGTRVFAQPTGVDQVLIGRRVPVAGGVAQQVWQVDSSGPTFVDLTTAFNDATDADLEPFPAGEGIGDYLAIGFPEPFGQVIFDGANGTAGVGGTLVWQYMSAPGMWVDLVGVTDGTTGFTTAVADGQTLTYTIPAGWAAQTLDGVKAYYIRAVVAGVYATNPVYDQGFVGTDANLTVSLDAIELADAESWYITNITTRSDAEIALLNTWTSARSKIAKVQSPDLTLVAALALQAASTNRTSLWFYEDSADYLDGSISSFGGGFDLDAPGGVGRWDYDTLEGIPFSPVTGPQATAIYAANANLYGRNEGLSFTSQGTMGSGRKIRVTTTTDWAVKRLNEAIIELQVNAKTVPYTNAGINQVVATVSDVMSLGVSAGHFSPDVPPEIIAPDISEVSAADKAAGLLTLTVNVTLAGDIGKVSITLNVTL